MSQERDNSILDTLQSQSDDAIVIATKYWTLAILFFIVVWIFDYYQNYGTSDEKREDEVVLSVNDIPGEKPVWPTQLIGNIPKLLPYANSFKRGMKWNGERPGLIKITGLNKVFVGFQSAPLIQQLLESTDAGHATKSPIMFDTMKPYIRKGLIISSGDLWRAQRKALMKTQSYESLKSYMAMLNQHGEQLVADLETLFADKKTHPINPVLNRTFLKILLEMVIGCNMRSTKELDRYHANFKIWKKSVSKRILHPWLLFNCFWMFHPLFKVQEKAVNEMITFTNKKIQERKHVREIVERLTGEPYLYKFIGADKAKFKSVLDELLDEGIDDDQILDEINTMLFAGHETGAAAIHYFTFCMALNPSIQDRCREEVDDYFDNPKTCPKGHLTFDSVQYGLKNVERCINETLRLFPPVFGIFRELGSPMVVQDGPNKYLLPEGTNVFVAPIATHRNPEYFPSPETFDPDRFLPELSVKRHPYSFIPFSGGPRKCLGLKFAITELKVVAAYLIRHFVIKTTDKMEDVPLLPFITLTPERDYIFHLEKRPIFKLTK